MSLRSAMAHITGVVKLSRGGQRGNGARIQGRGTRLKRGRRGGGSCAAESRLSGIKEVWF